MIRPWRRLHQRRAWWGLLLLAWVAQAAGQEAAELQGRVSASLAGDGPYWVGQAITVRVDLASTGFAFADQRFELPEVPGALVLQPESTAFKLSERDGDVTWQILRYELLVVPQRAGGVSFPAMPVAFTASAGYGKAERAFELNTEPVGFEAALPPGVEAGTSVVTTTALAVAQKWDPAEGERKVGDAVTRTLSLTADRVPGMALPPLAVAEIPSVAVYPAQPRVEDRVDRGDFTGERVDSHTYVFQRVGEVQIPGASIQWWNPERRQLQQVQIEPLSVKVLPNPAMKGAAPGWLERLMRRPWMGAAALLVPALLLWALYRYWGTLRARWAASKRSRHESEAAYFRRLLERLRAKQPGPAYSALSAWAARRGLDAAPTLRAAFQHAGATPELLGELDSLQHAAAYPDAGWNGERAEGLLKAFRARLARASERVEAGLPGLNPRGTA
jgi:hypothetical protein